MQERDDFFDDLKAHHEDGALDIFGDDHGIIEITSEEFDEED